MIQARILDVIAASSAAVIISSHGWECEKPGNLEKSTRSGIVISV
jgi:hypothetical protein